MTLAGVYLMVGGLMFYSGKGKLFDDDGNAPQYIKDQFKGTFIDTFPGADTAWATLGVLEFGVFVLLLRASSDLSFSRTETSRFCRSASHSPCWSSPAWPSADGYEPVRGTASSTHTSRPPRSFSSS